MRSSAKAIRTSCRWIRGRYICAHFRSGDRCRRPSVNGNNNKIGPQEGKMDSTPISLMPTMSLCGEFVSLMEELSDKDRHAPLGDLPFRACRIWNELLRRGVT